jgi:hypothetical protein
VLEERLLWFVGEVQSKKPEIILHTGDAIDGKRGREMALTEIERFYSVWNQIPEGIVTIFVPGNRDIGSLYETVEDDWVLYTGKNDKIAGSYFNRTIDVSIRGINVRFITISDFSQTLDVESLFSWLSEVLSVRNFHAIVILSHSATYYTMVKDILENELTPQVPVYFLHGHEHGGKGMTLQEEDTRIPIQRYLLGGLQDGYYGAVQTVFQKVIPFLVQPPFYEEIIIDTTGISIHRTVYP